MTTLTIDLPDNLAEEAKQAGLLTPNAIETILRETLRHLPSMACSLRRISWQRPAFQL